MKSLERNIQNIQKMLDKIEAICGRTSDSHILVLPVTAAVSPEVKKIAKKRHKIISRETPVTREELYHKIILGTKLDTDFMLLTVLISSIFWLIIGSFAGIPLSSTHSLVGSIVGVVFVYALTQGDVNPETAFNWTKLNNVILGWFLSPTFGLIITFVLFKVLAKSYLSRLKGLNQIEKSERYFKWMLLLA